MAINFWGPVNSASSPRPPVRAILLKMGGIYQITDAELGTNLKPLVLLSDGTIKERAASEGQPLVYDATIGGLRTIASNEILQI